MLAASGDKNGYDAPAVPLTGRASPPSSDRIHSIPRSPVLLVFAVNTTLVPSGDSAGGPEPVRNAKIILSGGVIAASTTRGRSIALRAYSAAKTIAAIDASTNAT